MSIINKNINEIAAGVEIELNLKVQWLKEAHPISNAQWLRSKKHILSVRPNGYGAAMLSKEKAHPALPASEKRLNAIAFDLP